jgi:hypothetical protein
VSNEYIKPKQKPVNKDCTKMSGTSKVTIQKLLLSPTRIEEVFSKIENILSNLELKNLKTKISTPPAYLRMQFTAFKQKSEIQITFEPRVEKTLLNVIWSLHVNEENFEKTVLSQYHFSKLEELRVRITATEISSTSFTDSIPAKSAKSTVGFRKNVARLRINSRFFLHCSCPVCGEAFQNPKDLRTHRDKTHKTKKVNL